MTHSSHRIETLKAPLSWDFEKELTRGSSLVAGVDEVGRGCLAGPVYAAAVVLSPTEEVWVGLNDSKKLSKKRREIWSRNILEYALAVSVGQASVEEIDRLNILHAARLAMARAVQALHNILGKEPEWVLVDGTYEPLWQTDRYPQTRTVVDGDALCPSIAAASIVAKVERDHYMETLARSLPGYGFEHNAGYGTKEHLSALETLGPTTYHRRSFSPVAQYLQSGLNLHG